MQEQIKKAIAQLRQTKPLVLCLTNYVTMDFMANTLLALGAAPLMSCETSEFDELLQLCHAVYINIGTLDESFILRCTQAIALAQRYHKPIVLDPVGAGASKIRTQTAREFMQAADIIRGNASEIMALADSASQTLGVESMHQVSDAKTVAQQLANKLKCTIVVSGPEDFVTDGTKEIFLCGGSPLMPLVTGMGCSLTAVIAAFRAVITDSMQAATLATAYFGLCGSAAAQKTDKPGAFRTMFIDEVYSHEA